MPGVITAQEAPLFQELMATAPSKPGPIEIEKLQNFITALQQKEVKSEKKFLEFVFKATHKKYLKNYSQYADLNETLAGNRFDCLTATALFSVVLTESHFDFRILETNYHIFILVNTSEGQVLLETTDRLSGFVDNDTDIAHRISGYRQNKIASTSSEYYQYSFDLFHEVKPNQVAGLLYFNQAIKAYNRHDLVSCATLLEQSKNIYESPRTEELAIILIKSVIESDLSADVKGRVIHQYKNYIVSKNSPVASR